ncbi:MAG TPA: hypothetical protein VMR14_16195 [Streptosporangiaceae bacterium]|jgi:hypothetical protein|nr:hypothetical protein [Streptosporangiaceae bacterium]
MTRLRAAIFITTIIGVVLAPTAYCLAATPARHSKAQVTNVPCGTKLSTVNPAANSTIALQRGCTYTGTLAISANNVTVSAYGTGSVPVIKLSQNGATVDISSSDVTIENLSLVGVAPGTWNCGGKKTPAGQIYGVKIESGALSNTITGISATGLYAGVYVAAGSTGNVIENSTFTNNTELSTNNSSGSSGAFGVLLWGSSNIIQDNTITGNQACSIAFGHDGSAVEVFGGSHNVVSDNDAANDNAFTELGSYPGGIATGNTYTGNTVSDAPAGLTVTFLITRGSGDPDGPVYNTVATDNTVTLTNSGDEGAVSYDWQKGDGTLLTLTGNYLNLGQNQALYEDGGYVNGGGNTFIGTCNPSSACN